MHHYYVEAARSKEAAQWTRLINDKRYTATLRLLARKRLLKDTGYNTTLRLLNDKDQNCRVRYYYYYLETARSKERLPKYKGCTTMLRLLNGKGSEEMQADQ